MRRLMVLLRNILGIPARLLHPNAPKVEPPKIVTERIRRMRELGGEL